jgi:lysophospholipase L1-like esterase
MKGLVRTLFVSALLLFGAFPASAAADDPPAPLQLGLGDSWAAGFGASAPSEGYVPQLHAALKDDLNCSGAGPVQSEAGCPHLGLLNVARGGATTPSMIATQFPQAIPVLEARNGNLNPRDDVEVTTLHIGGNDVATPILNACLGGFTSGCVTTIQAELAAYEGDLDFALSALRGAAGDGRIVIGTYDNTFKLPTCSLSLIPGVSTLGDIVLEGGAPGVSQGLHDIMRAVGATYEVEVANVFGKFDSQDGFDCLHPDDSGYDKVTDAFLEVFGFEPSG